MEPYLSNSESDRTTDYFAGPLCEQGRRMAQVTSFARRLKYAFYLLRLVVLHLRMKCRGCPSPSAAVADNLNCSPSYKSARNLINTANKPPTSNECIRLRKRKITWFNTRGCARQIVNPVYKRNSPSIVCVI